MSGREGGGEGRQGDPERETDFLGWGSHNCNFGRKTGTSRHLSLQDALQELRYVSGINS